MTEFDPLDHARRKARKYELEAQGLRTERDKLLRMLALTLEVATARTGVSPTVFCALVEEMVNQQAAA